MSFRNRPGFFVIGAQRSGTTRLCHLLDQHPEVSIPSKEPFYFQTPEAMTQKRDWYRALFAGASGSIFGEGSTYYSMTSKYPGTAQRIHDYNPAARIVYIVRHPLRRIESAWHHLLSVGHLSSLARFKTVLMQSDDLIDPSLYWRQLTEYRRLFPEEQIRVFFFEDFVADEGRVLGDCLAFLGAPPVDDPLTDRSIAQNASEGMTQQWALVDAAKAVPGYQLVKRLVPQRVKTTLTERLRKPIRSRPRWDDELYEYVVGRVWPDTVAFLDHVGRPPEQWDPSDVKTE
jgi:sulfotransferase family protein